MNGDQIRAIAEEIEAEHRRIAENAKSALDCLEHLTTEEFAHGGDRPARDALARILHILGEMDEETLRV